MRMQVGAPNASPGTSATLAFSIRYLGQGAQCRVWRGAQEQIVHELSIGRPAALLDPSATCHVLQHPARRCTYTPTPAAHLHSVSTSGTGPKPLASTPGPANADTWTVRGRVKRAVEHDAMTRKKDASCVTRATQPPPKMALCIRRCRRRCSSTQPAAHGPQSRLGHDVEGALGGIQLHTRHLLQPLRHIVLQALGCQRGSVNRQLQPTVQGQHMWCASAVLDWGGL